jgi:small membrane protein
MTILQVAFIAFALFALSRTFVQFKRGALTIVWLLFWMIFWLVVGVVVILPQTTDILARFVGVGRGADLITYISLVALFFLVFKMFAKIESVEQEITRLVRKLAIEDSEESNDTTS